MEAPLAPLGARSRSRCCAGSVERIRLGATLVQRHLHSLRRPQTSIIHYDANITVSESCCSRCPLALAGVRRAGLAVLRGTEVVHCRPKGRAKHLRPERRLLVISYTVPK